MSNGLPNGRWAFSDSHISKLLMWTFINFPPKRPF
jgi:hypothetical protein